MRLLRFLLFISFASCSLLFSSPAMAQITLGTAEDFGVLAGSTVTNTGPTTINGNVGVAPGTAVTGFPPGSVVPPSSIHSADAVALQAQADLTAAYTSITTTPTLIDLTGSDLGGQTLRPSVYGFTSSAQLTGPLMLDAEGNADAVFIIKIASALTTASFSTVTLINGGSECNVFWQIGSSATIGTGSSFIGNILALTSITLNSGSNLTGRALARNGAVSLANTHQSLCAAPQVCPVISLSPATLPNPAVGIAYSQILAAAGGAAPYAFSIGLGSLPPGLTLGAASGEISGVPTEAGTLSFLVVVTDANGCSTSHFYAVTTSGVGTCPAIALHPFALPAAEVGIAYDTVVTASGGTAPYTFEVTLGSLPPGLSLEGGSGRISGTPTATGSSSFTLTVTDANGCPGSLPYAIQSATRGFVAIPTLSEWGLTVLVLLLGFVGARRLRRRPTSDAMTS